MNQIEKEEYVKELTKIYGEFIEEVTLDDIKEKVANGELDENNAMSAWVNDFMGDKPVEKAKELYDYLVDTDAIGLVHKEPGLVFKKVYAITGANNRQHVIATFKDDVFSDSAKNDDLSDFTIAQYYKTQEKIENKKIEHYDPLKFGEQQKKIDDIEEKYKNKEITYAQKLAAFGQISNEDVKDIEETIKKMQSGELTNDDIKKEMQENSSLIVYYLIVQDCLKNDYPDLYEKMLENL